MPEPAKPSKKPTLGEWLFGHAILFVGLALFPAMVTAVAPVSVTRFSRSGETIRAEVSKRLLFVVPYRHLVVENVIGVNDTFRAGAKASTARQPMSGAASTEDEAFLIIQGDGGSAKVPVSPVNIRGVLEKTRAFLDNPQQAQLRLITVANWKFSVIVGGLLSLLTLLYIFILVQSPLRALRQRLGGTEPEKTGEPPTTVL